MDPPAETHGGVEEDGTSEERMKNEERMNGIKKEIVIFN